jgi:hypothetical protein
MSGGPSLPHGVVLLLVVNSLRREAARKLAIGTVLLRRDQLTQVLENMRRQRYAIFVISNLSPRRSQSYVDVDRIATDKSPRFIPRR